MQKGPLWRVIQVVHGRDPRVSRSVSQARRSGTRGKALWTHLGNPQGVGSGAGDFVLWSGAVFEAPAFIAGFNDLTVMGEPVEESGGHLGVTKDGRPFAEGKVGGDNH